MVLVVAACYLSHVKIFDWLIDWLIHLMSVIQVICGTVREGKLIIIIILKFVEHHTRSYRGTKFSEVPMSCSCCYHHLLLSHTRHYRLQQCVQASSLESGSLLRFHSWGIELTVGVWLGTGRPQLNLPSPHTVWPVATYWNTIDTVRK